jgi:hypothetical protein
VLEAKKEFEDTHGAGDKLQMCQSRLESSMRDNREKYGPRENFARVRDYLKEDKTTLDRFYIQANMFDPRFESLIGQQKQSYHGKSP